MEKAISQQAFNNELKAISDQNKLFFNKQIKDLKDLDLKDFNEFQKSDLKHQYYLIS